MLDHALVRDAPLQLQHGPERQSGQRLQGRPLLGKGLGDDALRGGVHAHVRDRVEPVRELGVEVVEIAEGAREEEVLPDVAEGALDLTLRLGPDRAGRLSAGSRSGGRVRRGRGCR